MNDREGVSLRCSAAVFWDGSILLCRRLEDEVPTWTLPGGTPKPGEGSANCAQRELREETGIVVDLNRVAFVLEATSPDGADHVIEIVFLGFVRDAEPKPTQQEAHLRPEFVSLDEVAKLRLLPPLAGYLRGLSRRPLFGDEMAGTAAYLGNVWRDPEISLRRDQDAGGEGGRR
jgi:ADP-ribose pyrophosphatase YjhB (NUDIX family)